MTGGSLGVCSVTISAFPDPIKLTASSQNSAEIGVCCSLLPATSTTALPAFGASFQPSPPLHLPLDFSDHIPQRTYLPIPAYKATVQHGRSRRSIRHAEEGPDPVEVRQRLVGRRKAEDG